MENEDQVKEEPPYTFEDLDLNNDGVATEGEVVQSQDVLDNAGVQFHELDQDGDLEITREEWRDHPASNGRTSE